jgi:hypothetical protein
MEESPKERVPSKIDSLDDFYEASGELLEEINSFAEKNGLKLRFHMNGSRKECKADNVYKNLVNLFEHAGHQLILIPWYPHEKFLVYIKECIDIAMQISFSETFNIVAADSTVCGVPTIGSKEIEWLSKTCVADCTDATDIVKKLQMVYDNNYFNIFGKLNLSGLKTYNKNTKKSWKTFFKGK